MTVSIRLIGMLLLLMTVCLSHNTMRQTSQTGRHGMISRSLASSHLEENHCGTEAWNLNLNFNLKNENTEKSTLSLCGRSRREGDTTENDLNVKIKKATKLKSKLQIKTEGRSKLYPVKLGAWGRGGRASPGVQVGLLTCTNPPPPPQKVSQKLRKRRLKMLVKKLKSNNKNGDQLKVRWSKSPNLQEPNPVNLSKSLSTRCNPPGLIFSEAVVTWSTGNKIRNKLIHLRFGNRKSGTTANIIDWNLGARFWENKTVEIQHLVDEHRPDMVFISESNLRFMVPDHENNIVGYYIVATKDLEPNGLSRLILLVREGFNIEIHHQLMEEWIASIWVKIPRKGNKKLLVGGGI